MFCVIQYFTIRRISPLLAKCRFSLPLKRRHLHTKSGMSRKDNVLLVGSRHWEHLQMPRIHIEFGSGLAVSLTYKRGLGAKEANIAFPGKAPLGLVFIHWVGYTLQVRSFQSLVLCHLFCVCLQAIITFKLCVQLDMLVKRRYFHTKSCFYRKENMFCVGLKLLKLPENN